MSINRRIILLCFFMAGAVGAFATYNDTLTKQHGFNVLLSFKPILNALSAKDSTPNYMYSHNQLELQYRYKRHYIGLGLNYNSKKTADDVNGLPREITKKNFSFAPYYSYMFYKSKKWKFFGGAGYYKNTISETNEVISSIEVVTKSTKAIEEGFNGFLRINYKINKKLSLEFETAFYRSRERVSKESVYTLTPALYSNKTTYNDYRTYAFPANLWLKVSI